MNKKTISIILIVIAVIGILAWLKPKSGNKDQKKDMGPGKGPAARVSGIIIKTQKLANKISVSGSVLANEEVDLRPEASGKITQLLFKEGSRVKKGELLVKINDSDLQAQLSKLDYQRKLSEEKEFRLKKLLSIQALSQEEYDAGLNQLNTIKADVQLIKSQIAKTEIRAPFDGTIGLKYVSEGSFISPTTTVASLQNINPVKIDFSVPERYMSTLEIGAPVSFSIQGSDKKYTAKVYAIEPKIDVATRTVHVRARSENEDGKIYPGAFASVELVMKEIEDAIMIPTQALIPELKGQKVFISDSAKAKPRKVMVGIRTDTEVQITEGLKPGDTLITTGIMQLKPDAGVKVKVK